LSVTDFSIYKGKLVQEVYQSYNSWLSQTVRLYQNSTTVEFDWHVGSINVSDGIGREVIFKLNSDLKSEKLFYTDSNGRQLMRRKRDFRPNIPDYYITERVSGNYYPINSRIYLRDEVKTNKPRQVTLVTDRSQGASSIVDGSIEIMLHRRLLHDDSLGENDPLNEKGADGNGLNVKGKIHLIFNTTKQSARVHRDLAHRINSQPFVAFVTNLNSQMMSNLIDNKQIKSMINEDVLPDNIHLLTLKQEFTDEQQTNNSDAYSMILRLEHYYEVNEDDEYSKEVNIDLQNFFDEKSILVLNIKELSLGANMDVEELDKRLVFRSQESDNSTLNQSDEKQRPVFKLNTPFIIDMKPFQIKTFRVTYSFV
jgi:lysosomal alpha-mannosidase